MTEAECLAIIAQGDEDAVDLLRRLAPWAEKRFKKVDKALRDLLADVRQVFPDAEYYTASGGFSLLLGASHAENSRQTPQQQLTALIGYASIGDGDY